MWANLGVGGCGQVWAYIGKGGQSWAGLDGSDGSGVDQGGIGDMSSGWVWICMLV